MQMNAIEHEMSENFPMCHWHSAEISLFCLHHFASHLNVLSGREREWGKEIGKNNWKKWIKGHERKAEKKFYDYVMNFIIKIFFTFAPLSSPFLNLRTLLIVHFRRKKIIIIAPKKSEEKSFFFRQQKSADKKKRRWLSTYRRYQRNLYSFLFFFFPLFVCEVNERHGTG